MADIRNAKISLNGVNLQVNKDGFKAGGISIIDDSQPWLSRERIGSLRANDDSLGFDVTTLNGKRVRVAYASASGLPLVPQNNNAAINSLYRRYLEHSYAISGVALAKTDAVAFYEKYSEVQILWAKRQTMLAKINDPDISVGTRDMLVGQLNAIYGSIIGTAFPLVAFGSSKSVVFAEGGSCQFSDWVIAPYLDYSFNLVNLTLID